MSKDITDACYKAAREIVALVNAFCQERGLPIDFTAKEFTDRFKPIIEKSLPSHISPEFHGLFMSAMGDIIEGPSLDNGMVLGIREGIRVMIG